MKKGGGRNGRKSGCYKGVLREERKRKKRNSENRGQGNIDGRQSLWGWREQVPREKGCFIKRGIVATG